jgi:hypothetical protein
MPIPQPRSAQVLSESTIFQWEKQTLRADIVLVVPVALCLAIGIAIGHPAAGMISAGGAVNTGCGQKHCIDNSSLLPMVFVTFAMAFSGFFGVLIGPENLLLVSHGGTLGIWLQLLTNRPEGYI